MWKISACEVKLIKSALDDMTELEIGSSCAMIYNEIADAVERLENKSSDIVRILDNLERAT